MGIDPDTQDPPGGIIEREADGKTPCGVMQENAHFLIFFKMIPNFSQEDLFRLYKAGKYSYKSNGFTTVQERKTDLSTLRLLPKIAATEGFDVDVNPYPYYKVLKDNPISQSNLMSADYQNRLCLGGVKLTFDGSPQGKTAWFTEPYFEPPAGQPQSYSGYPAFQEKEALELMRTAYDNWW